MAVRSLAQSSLVEPFSNSSMLAGYESNYFHHLETVRLSSNAATVEFSNLARYSDFQHLQLRIVAKDDMAGQNALPMGLRLNGDTGANYSWHQVGGNGSSVSSSAGTSRTIMFVGLSAGAASTANAFSGAVIDLLDPFETTKYTTARGLSGLTSGNFIRLYSGNWRNTAAVTSILIDNDGTGSFIAGSRFSLYGIKARS